MIDAHELAGRLARDALSVCKHLLPAGKLEGREWKVGGLDGHPGNSLKVVVQGDKAGVWADFGDGRKEAAGDLLDLWKATQNISLAEAMRRACEYLRIDAPKVRSAREAAGKGKRKVVRPAPPKTAKPVTAKSSAVYQYLVTERGLYPETLNRWQIVEDDVLRGTNKDGKAYAWPGPWIVFPYLKRVDGKMILTNLKYLHVKREADGSKRTQQSKDAEYTLWGWHLSHPEARACVIVEGEPDAMTVEQAVFELGLNKQISVFSVPAGGGTGDKHKWIEADYEDMARFDHIYLGLDMDEEGRAGNEDIAKRLGRHRCYRITWAKKDPNDCLLKAGWTEANFLDAINSAELMKPDTLRAPSEFRAELFEEFYPTGKKLLGIPMPFRRMYYLRFRDGEVTVWTGMTGHGKSIILSQVENGAMDEGQAVMVASMEMKAAKTLARKARQLSQVKKPSREELERILEWLDRRLYVYDVLGKTTKEELLDAMRYARRRYGVKSFTIDSLMRVGLKADDFEGQDNFIIDLCAFADEEDCHVHLVAHGRKQEDEAKPLNMFDVKGSGGIIDNAFNVCNIWRNKAKERKMAEIAQLIGANRDSKEAAWITKPDAKVICEKQRNGDGEGGVLNLWFDTKTLSYREDRSGTAPALLTFVPEALSQKQSAPDLSALPEVLADD
jgi:twinkle protein